MSKEKEETIAPGKQLENLLCKLDLTTEEVALILIECYSSFGVGFIAGFLTAQDDN